MMRDLLSGPNVRLTALRDMDYDIIAAWFNDVRFLRYYDPAPALPKRQQEIKEYFDGFINSSERYVFAIRMDSSDKLIGIVGFDDIIWSNGVATLFIGIGEEQYTDQGLGSEALRLMLDFGFNELNFYRIQLVVIAYNEAAIHLYEKTGFIKEGTCRDFIFRDGERHDLYLYGLLKKEWLDKR